MQTYVHTKRHFGGTGLNHTVEAYDPHSPERLTKTAILYSQRQALEAALERVNANIRYLDEPFKDGDGECSGCHQPIATERQFADHFTVSDPRYPNLGECPNRKREE
jgi:hypothetical protein